MGTPLAELTKPYQKSIYASYVALNQSPDHVGIVRYTRSNEDVVVLCGMFIPRRAAMALAMNLFVFKGISPEEHRGFDSMIRACYVRGLINHDMRLAGLMNKVAMANDTGLEWISAEAIENGEESRGIVEKGSRRQDGVKTRLIFFSEKDFLKIMIGEPDEYVDA